jgi:hypoxanthine phosphoribosyltransferase
MKPELRPLVSEAELAQIVADLAARIRADYEGKDLLLVGLLKGSFVFMADLMRALDMPAEVDFMSATSYAGRESTGELVILKGLNESVHNRHVVIVEDIIDTGLTLSRIRERLLLEGPASLAICTLIDKPARRQTEVPVTYVGREIPDLFIVGYGIDFDQKYRWLPYIGTID